MLLLQDISYIHPNGDTLFSSINLSIHKHDKLALIGNNGSGKSSLLNILAGNLKPSGGLVKAEPSPWYVPQHFGQFDTYTIAQALGIENKLMALQAILGGQLTDANLAVLNDDWNIEARCLEAFAYWNLEGISLSQKLGTLSGGQKTKVYLAGISISESTTVLLDEPSNHLDTESREKLYEYIRQTRHSLVVVSHDRTLLNLLHTVYELSPGGLSAYGGNYEFYAAQKQIEAEALNQELRHKEKALRKAKETEKESMERQQKLDARGKKKQEKAGLPTILMNTFKNKAENSTSQMKEVHAEKVETLSQDLKQLRKDLPAMDTMKLDLRHSALHKGKTLFTARGINAGYNGRLLWKQGLDIQVLSGERIAIKGPNGSGKTSLIKLILGTLEPQQGDISRAGIKSVYIDQDYSLIDNRLSVYEQAQQYNSGALEEHEVKIRLSRFLFGKDEWNKPCATLSGGEKMRLALCALMIGNQAPDMMVLDEPTNNLDIQNIEILTAAINAYKGTLIVISHDAYFLEDIQIERAIVLE